MRRAEREGERTMETIALQLDPQTLARARRFAALRHRTLEELLKDIIEHLGGIEIQSDHFWGMCADEPTLMDEVVALAMQARAEHPLRASVDKALPLQYIMGNARA
jgi:hypothetical protein